MALYYIVVKHRISIDNFIIMEHIEYVFMNTITKIHDLVNSKHITSLTLHGKMNSKSYAMKIPPRSLHRFHKKMSPLSALIFYTIGDPGSLFSAYAYLSLKNVQNSFLSLTEHILAIKNLLYYCYY